VKLIKTSICLAQMTLLTSLSGCATLGYAEPPEVDDITVSNIFNIDKKSLTAALSKSATSSFAEEQTIEVMAFAIANEKDEKSSSEHSKTKTSEKQKTLGALMIKASDDACYKYLTEISTVEKGTKSVLGTVSILLSGAAGLATPVRSANLLSGISAATQGIEEELGSTILGGLEADILVQAVRKGRARQRKALSDILLSDKPSAGFNMFITEFSTYHDSCGISYGRDVLRNAVSAPATDEKPASGEVRSLESTNEKT